MQRPQLQRCQTGQVEQRSMKRQQQQVSRPLTLPIEEQPTINLPAAPGRERRQPRRKRSLPLAFLLVWDALLINLAFMIAYYIRYHVQGSYYLTTGTQSFYIVPYSAYLPL
jgi:hypothetical protein